MKRFHIGFFLEADKLRFSGKTFECADAIDALQQFLLDETTPSDINLVKYVLDIDDNNNFPKEITQDAALQE